MQTDLQDINLSNPPRSRATGHKSRHVAQLSNVPLVGRSVLMSKIQQVASQAPLDARFPRLMAFLQFWKWLVPYLRDVVHKDADYRVYQNGETGIFDIAAPGDVGPLRIAVAADWGTGTLEAETVAENMKACFPHYTLHLGDVYYMGEAAEISENCLGVPTKGYAGVSWPKGSLGSFALMGNHEMYSGGQGYLNDFLEVLGLLNADSTVRVPQSASYFCLEAEHWIILGLDTGYHSGGVPLLGSIPGLNSIPFLNVNARFDDRMLAWLKRTMAVLQATLPKKPILILTHHQPLSSFEAAFEKPAKQLLQLGFLEGQQFVWLYGHEHRLTVYNEQTIATSLKVYARCVGHAGMPVDVTKLRKVNPNIAYYDPRQHPIDDQDPKTMVGYNGHAVLVLEGTRLTIEYHDILKNNLLLTETFAPDGNGALQYSYQKPEGSSLVSGQQIG